MPDHLGHHVLDQVAAVVRDLRAPGSHQLARRHAVARQEALHVGGRRVARLAAVDDGDPAPGPGQDQGRGQSGGAAADHDDVVLVMSFMTPGCVRPSCSWQRLLPFLGTGGGMPAMDPTPIADALDQVGPRLKRIRTERGVTLTDAVRDDGHLEEHAVAAGERPAAPEPRAAPAARAGPPGPARRPRRRARGRRPADPPQAATGERPHRRPADQAARRGAGLEDRHPCDQSKPQPRTHDGYEWLYVLTGQMRLVLGDQDFVLEPGEAVEFDTTLPHWFGSTGEGPAEVLSIFGRPGERMHVREYVAPAKPCG